MAGSGRERADDVLLLALACGATLEQATTKAGVSLGTASRRLRDPAFRLALQQLKSEIVQRACDNMAAAAGESVRTLLELQQRNQPAPVRLGAARAVLEIGIKMREATDLEQRLIELEQRLSDNAMSQTAALGNGNGAL